METVWKKIKSAMRDRIPKHSFQMWIEPLELEKGTSDDWILLCPNFFSKKRVHDLYGELIKAELSRQTGGGCNLSFADGHCGYWKYKDPRTIRLAIETTDRQDEIDASVDNIDLDYMAELLKGPE